MKYLCFICKRDSRAKNKHYSAKRWKKCQKLAPDERDPLNDSARVFSPPLHIKLDLVNTFVGTMKKNVLVFSYLQQTTRCLSEAKISEGIFVGPQIRKLTKINF
jgi:hypothetical protein